MRHFATICVLAGALIFSGPALAAGSGDHHHPEEITQPASASVEEPAHDNADGHHDMETPTVIESDDHNNVSMDDHHEGVAEDHHGEAGDDHPDAMVEVMGHDHSAHEGGTWATTDAERFFAWVGKFHPAATNFPIALLLMAFLAEALYAARGGEGLRHAMRFCLWSGAMTALGTAILGWSFVGFDIAGDDSILSVHRWNGTTLAALALLAVWLGERVIQGRGGRLPFRLVLILVAGMAAYNGYLGGKMVYGPDHYAWPVG